MSIYRDYGTIFRSFVESIDDIKTQKEKCFYMESLLKISLFGEIISENFKENLGNFENFSENFLKICEKNNYFLAKTVIKNLIPIAKKSYTKFLNGSKGKDFGSLGGAPKGNNNARKNNPENNPETTHGIGLGIRNKDKGLGERNKEDISNSPSFEICETNSKTSASKNNTQQKEGSSIVEFNDFEYSNEAAYRIREFTEEEAEKLIKEVLKIFDIEIGNCAAADLILNKIAGELEEQKAKFPQKYASKDDFETLKKFIRQKGKPEQEQYTMQFIEDFIKEYPHAGEIGLKLHQF